MSEVEEIAPRDQFSASADFKQHVIAFFNEADFDNTFNKRDENVSNDAVQKTIVRVVRQCVKELRKMENYKK